MASPGIWHWLIVFGVVALIFCTKNFADSDVVAAARNFRKVLSFPIWFHVGVASILLLCLLAAARMLTRDEFAELGSVLELTVRALHGALSPAKEYAACYAEAKGFEHIHFHVVPRAQDMPEELLGAGSFELLRVPRPDAADPDAVKAFCESLQKSFPSGPR